jgi:hypothetical protein
VQWVFLIVTFCYTLKSNSTHKEFSMLTAKTIQGVHAFKQSWRLGEGACFGVTDPSRLRAPTLPTGQQAAASKGEQQKKRVPAMRVLKKKK